MGWAVGSGADSCALSFVFDVADWIIDSAGAGRLRSLFAIATPCRSSTRALGQDRQKNREISLPMGTVGQKLSYMQACLSKTSWLLLSKVIQRRSLP